MLEVVVELVVIDLNVLMDQHVAKPLGSQETRGQFATEDRALRKDRQGIAIVSRRPPVLKTDKEPTAVDDRLNGQLQEPLDRQAFIEIIDDLRFRERAIALERFELNSQIVQFAGQGLAICRRQRAEEMMR